MPSVSNTSLLFHGKGSNEYGERFQENFYHLLENFSSFNAPIHPIDGQLWYDNNDKTFKIFQIGILEIYDIYNDDLILKIIGNPNARYFQNTKDSLISKFSNISFDIFGYSTKNLIGEYNSAVASDTSIGTYVPPNVAADLSQLITLDINSINDIILPSSPGLVDPVQTIGTWVPISHIPTNILDDVYNDIKSYSSFFGLLDDIDLGNNKLLNVYTIPDGDPDYNASIDDVAAITREYANDKFLPYDGGNLTGFLTLHADPTSNFHASTKQYTDNQISTFATIPGLSDTNIVGLLDNDLLQYNSTSGNWENIPDPLNGLTSSDFITTTSGGTISSIGTLTLSGQPGQNGVSGSTINAHAATIGYITDSLLTRTISPTNTYFGDFLDSKWNQVIEFPDINVDLQLQSISQVIRNFQKPNFNDVIISNGRSAATPYDVNVELGFYYTAGYGNLQVYVQ